MASDKPPQPPWYLSSRVVLEPQTGRLRPLWLVVLPIFLTQATSISLFTDLVGVIGIGAFVGHRVLDASLAMGILWLWHRYASRRPLRQYLGSLTFTSLHHFVAGVLLGSLAPAVVGAIFLVMGWATVEATLSAGPANQPFWLLFAGFVLAYLCVGVTEEVVYRGIFLTDGVDGLTRFSDLGAIAIITLVSTLVFVVVHRPTTWLYVVLLAESGLLYAVAYLTTGELALPVGMHFATNLVGLIVLPVLAAGQPTLYPAVVRLSYATPEPVTAVALLSIGLQLTTAGFLLLWVWWATGDLRFRAAPVRRD